MNDKKMAVDFRHEIWEVFQMAKNKEVSHEIANASVACAREFLRSYALECKVRSMSEPKGPALREFFNIEDKE